jgi:hypothetical protein
MSYNSKDAIIQRLNGCTPFDVVVPKGPVETKQAMMPIEIVLKSILKAHGLAPGTDCQVLDYATTPDGVKITFNKGEFGKDKIVSDKLADLFTDGQAEPNFDDK